MAPDVKTQTLRVGGMSCANCESAIRNKLRGIAGIKGVEVSYAAGTARVTYDAGRITLERIIAIIGDLGYQASVGGERPKTNLSRAIGMVIIIAAIYILLELFGILKKLVPPTFNDDGMTYGLLFVFGLLTSVHCVAMCGGINLSQCLPKGGDKAAAGPARGGGPLSVLQPSILYNLGRVISYTIVGFAAGALGSAVAFSDAANGVLKLIAGLFMIIMGVCMLDLFPWARRLVPRMPKFISGKASAVAQGKGPLVVGLLNGLMPCGPMLFVQLWALKTQNPVSGALSMFLFSLGTVPLMFGLGTFSSVAGKKYANKVMTVGAVMVAVLGLSTLSQVWQHFGLTTGLPPAAAQRDSGKKSGTAIDMGPQVINSTLSPYGYPSIKVESGRPVKWIINAPPGSINGCNYKFVIREYGITYEFKTGENIVEFTPNRVGNVPYTCWMGMIPGTITVVSPGH
jgi:sulfite exporter TauE/SafE/copper chaperone CopZ